MRLRILLSTLFLSLFYCLAPGTVKAAVTTAEPAKSVYLDDFFRLYRFIPPDQVLLYENADLARKDIKQTIVSDSRPPQGANCTVGGGDDQCRGVVVLHNEVSPGNFETQTLNDAGVCRPNVTAGSSDGSPGYCDYRKKPTNIVDVTAIDYSKSSELAFPKLQNSFYAHWNNGGNNAIAWGADNLSVAASDQYVRRAITLAQAGETKEVEESGTHEPPLGGVRWDAPLDPNDTAKKPKTIHDVWAEIGGDADGNQVKGSAKVLLEYWKNMVKPPAAGEDISAPEIGNAIAGLNAAIARNLAKPTAEQPGWLQDFLKTPECGPGYDKGYVLTSVCMLGLCTPVGNAESFVNGNPSFRSQTVYSDTRIRQSLCAAVYNVYQQHPLKEAQDIMRKANKINPLLDCTLRSSPNCTPSAIEDRLSGLLASEYGQAGNKFFSLPWFHKVIDGWRDTAGGYWYVKFNYKFRTGGETREAGAVESPGILGVALNTASAIAQDWIDSVFQALHHTIVIPPLSAHSIDAIENATYMIRETSAQNALDDTAATDYNNLVDASTLKLKAGNVTAPKISQRNVAWWSCNDPLFSSPWLTKILDYISGGRFGCHGEIESAEKSAGGNICEIASKYGVPCCMLAGIWSAETDKGATKPSQSYGSYTCCNSIGACGETQIMGGLVPPLANGENLNPCKQADSFTLTSRLLVVKKCQLDGGCQDNKWTPEVSKKYAVKDDELYIAGMYYGTNQCAPDKTTQCRWGTGKSYCDAVLHYMESGCSITKPDGGEAFPDAPPEKTPAYCGK